MFRWNLFNGVVWKAITVKSGVVWKAVTVKSGVARSSWTSFVSTFSSDQSELQSKDVVIKKTNIISTMHQDDIDRHVRSSGTYKKLYEAVFRRSISFPEEFWAEAAEDLIWMKRWNKVLDDSKSPFTKWFVGGELNTCYNCLDRHVERGFGSQIAIIHDSPVTNSIKKITFKQLMSEVALFSSVLVKHGIKYGDRVLIYMPMIPECIVAMLACARVGAPHSLVFGGFAAKELGTRIAHAEPKVIVSANFSIEGVKTINYKSILDEAINSSKHKPKSCIIYNRKHEQFNEATLIKGRDYNYEEELTKVHCHDCVPVKATDPVYLLYTSGTTGQPKAVVRPSGGNAVVLNWSMYNVYGVNKHETWFAASDLGWVVGHSYIVYAPLLHCNTTILYEGKPVGTPDASAYYRIIKDHDVVAMFASPTAMRTLRKEDPQGHYAAQYSIPSFRYMFVAGEHCDHGTMEWMRNTFKVPALDNWWQTETGSAISSTCVGFGNDLYPLPGLAGKPVPGWNIEILKSDGKPSEVGELGNIVVKLPLPPASFSSLYLADDRFLDVYFKKFPGYYDTMDAGFRTSDGDIAVMARLDDVINVAGHRLSTGALEEAVLRHDDVAEAAVVGIPDQLKGQIPLGLCVLKSDVEKDSHVIAKEVISKVREHVGPVASFKDVIVVNRLPKTRSGKIARNTIAAMAAGQPYKIPVTIEDASVYEELESAFKKAGYDIKSNLN